MLWHNLKRTVLSRQPSNIHTLKQICQDGWSKFGEKSLKQLHQLFAREFAVKREVTKFKGPFKPTFFSLHCELSVIILNINVKSTIVCVLLV